MADTKFKKIIKQYSGLILALLVILIALGFYFFKESETKFGNQEIMIQVSQQSMPQFPTLFTSQGQLEVKIIYNEPSEYGKIVVFDRLDEVRELMIDGAVRCSWTYHDPQGPTTYTSEMVRVLKGYLADKQDILVIGFGCGGILKAMAGEDVQIDVVEINPKVIDVAEKYFVMPENLDYRVFTDDGLHFLRNSNKKYDIIIVDLCDILQINAHLYTEEFYKLAKEKLKDKDSWLIQSLDIYRQEDPHQIDHKVANSMLKYFSHLYITDRILGEDTFAVLNFFATNQAVETDSNPFILWQVKPEYGRVNQDNAMLIVQYHLPIYNRLRQQAVRNYGFEVRLE